MLEAISRVGRLFSRQSCDFIIESGIRLSSVVSNNHLSNNDCKNLSEDKFIISSDSKTVTFVGLSKSTGKADLLATVSKSKIRSKEKTLKKGAVLTISRSRLSSSKSSVDGLTYSAIYGTRVQDDRICLNVCDVADVLGIFESDNNSDPDLPSAVFTGFTGPNANTSNILIGEQIIGETSGSP